MKNRISYGAAVILVMTVGLLNGLAQQTREMRTITGNYYDTATIEPTIARIKSIKLPPGFQIAKFAELSNPRMLATATDGTIYVSQRDPGTLTMLKDTNGDGVADIQKVVAEKKMMHGLYIDGGKIYLVTVKEVFTADIKADGTLGELKMIISDLPDAGQHPNRTLAVKDGRIFITVGSTCNACDESTPENATILTTDLNGQNRRIFASGLRNTIGFGWHPVSKKMFGMDHGIDLLGDNDQEEELNELVEGEKYGWAYVYANGKLNPHNLVPKALGLTNDDWAKQSRNPVLLYTPHSAPMQMLFYTGSQFPAEYKNDALVAMRGSWNRNPPSGYEVVRIRFDKSGNPLKFEPFLTGFLVKGGAKDGKDAHFARLAGITQMKDGSVLIADDTNNIIYRVSYGKNAVPPIMSRDDVSMRLPETAAAKAVITVKSAAFAANGMLADKFSAYFDDVSPEISWSGVPVSAKSLVLMLEDPDAALKPVTHWIVANIPPSVTGFPENVLKTEKYGEALQGSNINGKSGYYGPRPPAGDQPHNYHLQIFALDKMLDLPGGFNRQALLDAMKGHVIAKGEIIARYQRKPDIRDKKDLAK